jgi:hypothetical protein
MHRLLPGALPELVFQILYFGQAAQVAVFAGELGVQVNPNNVICELLPNDPRTHNQDIHIVVLYALVGGIAVMTDTRAYAGDLIHGDGRSHTTSAYQDSSIRLIVKNRHPQSLGVIRIVGRLAAMSPYIQYLVPQFLDTGCYFLFHLESGMI